MEEVWLPVAGFEETYEVSNTGFVRSISRHGLVLAPRFTKHGYVRAALYKNLKQHSYLVHRLVAFAFIAPPPTAHHQVNHIDGDKTNNCADNLEWVTRSENGLHAYRRGLSVSRKGEQHGRSKLTPQQIDQIREMAGTMTQRAIAERFGIRQPQVCRILTKKRWAHQD